MIDKDKREEIRLALEAANQKASGWRMRHKDICEVLEDADEIEIRVICKRKDQRRVDAMEVFSEAKLQSLMKEPNVANMIRALKTVLLEERADLEDKLTNYHKSVMGYEP